MARCFRLTFTTVVNWSGVHTARRRSDIKQHKYLQVPECPHAQLNVKPAKRFMYDTDLLQSWRKRTCQLTHFLDPSVRWKRLANRRNVGWPKEPFKCPKNQSNTTRISRSAHRTLCSVHNKLYGYSIFLGNIIVLERKKEKKLKSLSASWIRMMGIRRYHWEYRLLSRSRWNR